nr:unnamed protein product [Digitaria exilis]
MQNNENEKKIWSSPIQGGGDDSDPDSQVPFAEVLEANATTDNLLNVRPHHGDLGHESEHDVQPVRVLIPTERDLCQPVRSRSAQRGAALHDEVHGGGPDEEPHQHVLGDNARLESPLDVAWVQEFNARQEPR